MISFKHFNILEESFKVATVKWIAAGASDESIKKAIDTFKTYKQRNVIDDVEKTDIGYWMNKPFGEFNRFLSSLKFKLSAKDAVGKFYDEVDIIKNDDHVLIIVPKTYRASRGLGCSQWCIVYGESYYNDYIFEQGLTPYYILFKNPTEFMVDNDLDKIAVMIDDNDNVNSVWNSNDLRIYEYSSYYETLGYYETLEDDDGEEIQSETTVGDMFDNYEIDIYSFETKLREIEQKQTLADEDFDLYFYGTESDDGTSTGRFITRFDKTYKELKEYYDDNDIPEDERLVKDDFKEYYYGAIIKAKEEYSDVLFTKSFAQDMSDIVNKPIRYPVTKYVDEMTEDFQEYFEENTEEVKIQYQYEWV